MPVAMKLKAGFSARIYIIICKCYYIFIVYMVLVWPSMRILLLLSKCTMCNRTLGYIYKTPCSTENEKQMSLIMSGPINVAVRN